MQRKNKRYGESKYKIGVPNKGVYEEIFSSDYEKYGGSGIVNGKVKAIAGKMHGKNQYLELEIPAFSTMYFYKKASKSKSNTKI